MRISPDRGRFPVHGLLLSILILVALAVRVSFLNGRWINPDEGAHLMDGLLVLEGFVPVADYASRQVFYTYMLAGVMRVVGVSYEAARFYPVVATVSIGVLVYLIARRLFDRRVSLLSAAIYLFLPFTIVFGTQVKTEPLTIVLSCLGVYTLLRGLDGKGGLVPFLVTGVFLGLAYYSRQSALALLLSALVIIVLLVHGWALKLRACAGVMGGFAVVCAALMISFTTVMPASRVFASSALNPAAFVVRVAQPIVRTSPDVSGVGAEGAAFDRAAGAQQAGTTDDAGEVQLRQERSYQPWRVTIQNVTNTANLNAFLLVSLFLSPFFLRRRRGGSTDRAGEGEGTRAGKVLYTWFGALLAAYTFYALVRGFFPAYFGEFLPPLSILAAVVGFDAVTRLRDGRAPEVSDLLIFAAVALGFVLLHATIDPLAINRPLYYVAVPALLAPIYLGGRLDARYFAALAVLAAAATGTVFVAGAVGGMVKLLLYVALLIFVFGVLFAAFRQDPRRDPARAGAFFAYSVLLGTFTLWLGSTQTQISRTFGGIWSPETVSEVATYLEQNTDPGDEVISGAVIWELQARRRPFLLLSHPLGFRAGMETGELRAVEARLRDTPPPVIIMDGYTEQTYQRNVPIFEDVLADHYRLERVVEGSFYPVSIYRLNAAGPAAPR